MKYTIHIFKQIAMLLTILIRFEVDVNLQLEMCHCHVSSIYFNSALTCCFCETVLIFFYDETEKLNITFFKSLISKQQYSIS